MIRHIRQAIELMGGGHGDKGKLVQIKTLEASILIDRIIREHPNKKVVLKIDCEGSEYKIFENLLLTNELEKVYMILMETHDGRENEIKSFLKKCHFIYFDNYVGYYPKIAFIYAINTKL